MKLPALILFLHFWYFLAAQPTVTGQYRDNFGNRIQLNHNGTFKHTWHFDLSASWSTGTWTLQNDTVFLNTVPVYDTLSYTNSHNRVVDSLVLSGDEVPGRIDNTQHLGVLLSSGGQNRVACPGKLLYKKGRLYKIVNGRRVTKKQKSFWGGSKQPPWYTKSSD